MCRVYGQSYAQTMAMPMRAFWQFNGFVPRLLTAEGLDHLQILAASQSPEGTQQAFESMGKAAPNPVKLSLRAQIEASAERDEEGFNALRALSG